MTKWTAIGAITAAFVATGAQAETVLLDYAGKDVKVEDTSQTYDFFDLGPDQGQIQPMTVNLVADEPGMPSNPGPFSPDGRADMRITSQDGPDGFGYIQFLYQDNFPMIEVAAIQTFSAPTNEYTMLYPVPMTPVVSQRIRFASLDDQLATFGADGENGFLVDDSFNYESDFVSLYGGKGPDLLEVDGDNAILGFRIEVLLEDMYGEYGYNMLTAVETVYCDDPEAMYFDECIIRPQETILATFYGFIEVTRGSVTPGILGVNSLLNTAAVVPNPVPLPASILLLGAGLGGLSVMRRRKTS